MTPRIHPLLEQRHTIRRPRNNSISKQQWITYQESKEHTRAMNTPTQTASPTSEDSQPGSSRRSFLKGAAFTGAATRAGLATAASAEQHVRDDDDISMKS